MFAWWKTRAGAEHPGGAGGHAWRWALLEGKGRERGWDSATWESTPKTVV